MQERGKGNNKFVFTNSNLHLPVSSLAAQTRMSTQAAFVCTFSLNLLIVDLKKGSDLRVSGNKIVKRICVLRRAAA